MTIFPLAHLLLLIPYSTSVIRGTTWFGCNLDHMSTLCDWQHPIDWHLSKIKEQGFNTVRLPFSYDYAVQADFGVMDQVVYQASDLGLDIILSMNSISKSHDTIGPYDGPVTFTMFTDAWVSVLDRYRETRSLKGLDVFNYFRSRNYEKWSNLVKWTLERIEGSFPNRFLYFVQGVNVDGKYIFVEGLDLYQDRVYHSFHKYWFSVPDELSVQNISTAIGHVVVVAGELGYPPSSESKQQVTNFIAELTKYNIRDSFFWSWTPNYYIGGVLNHDCNTLNEDKVQSLRRYWEITSAHNLRA